MCEEQFIEFSLKVTKKLQTISFRNVNLQKLTTSFRYYCLAAAAALIRYVEFVQNNVYVAQSLSVVYKGSEHTTLIDSKTAAMLELLVNLEKPRLV